MAGALKHKQRSHRSFYQDRKVLGSVATAAGINWLERFKQIFRSQKGDK